MLCVLTHSHALCRGNSNSQIFRRKETTLLNVAFFKEEIGESSLYSMALYIWISTYIIHKQVDLFIVKHTHVDVIHTHAVLSRVHLRPDLLVLFKFLLDQITEVQWFFFFFYECAYDQPFSLNYTTHVHLHTGTHTAPKLALCNVIIGAKRTGSLRNSYSFPLTHTHTHTLI